MSYKARSFQSVPLKDLPASALTQKSEPHHPVIFVVDDETVIADSLTEILNRSGYAAIPAYDAETALETALVMPPEVLISDVVLPNVNGIELALSVRRIFPDCHIILTSGQPASARLLSAAAGAGHQFTFVHKPVHPKELLERVSEFFKPRAVSERVRTHLEAAAGASMN